jgi:quinoprotein dehydrogenase-associated probable ABC transporter substrate-binding protein
MSSPCRKLVCALACLALCNTCASAAERALRVCAEPDNLPYSHESGSGFENRIAELVARELDASVEYTWTPLLRGFVRKTLNAHSCDVLMGVPSELDRVRTTEPYYRSTYVFVQRSQAGERFRAFDDPRLARARIGVQLIGDDLAATPPGHALAARGITQNVVGYALLGERTQGDRMIDDVARAVLDVALVWGPQAGYYARRHRVPLTLSVAQPPAELSFLPFEFSMSMGVRKNDASLANELDAAIAHRRGEIHAILAEYGVPLVDEPARRAARRTR